MKKCPFCAEEIEEMAIKCKHCGEFLTEIECPQCQNKVPPGINVCPKCSTLLNNRGTKSSSKSGKSKNMALLLTFLLGGIGIHKFYLEQPGWGIIYMLFCWTYIPVILAIIEGIAILSMSDEKFIKHYKLQ